MLHSETLIQPHASVVFTRLDETEGVLLHLDTKRYYSLNETGAYLWELIESEGGRSAVNIAQALHHAYDITSEEARHVVWHFVDALQRDDLIQMQAPVTA